MTEAAELLAHLAQSNPERYQRFLRLLRDVVDTEETLDTVPLLLRAKARIRRRRYKA